MRIPTHSIDDRFLAADPLSALNRPTGMTDPLSNHATYVYDSGGNLTTVQLPTPAGQTARTTTYSYDSMNRVVTVTAPLARTTAYTYDSGGNRNMTGWTTGTGNELTASPGYTYSYDNEGNLISQTETSTGNVWTYSYDNRNRLVGAVEKNSGGTTLNQATYTYDALNHRIGVKDNGAQIWTVFDGASPFANPYADFNGSGTLLTRYVSTQDINDILARTSSGGATAWYLKDRLGSVRDVVNTSGTVIDHVVYDSYGNIASETSPANGDRFKFTGMEWDAAIDQYYDHARWYGAKVGRFLGLDPKGFGAGDSNPYRFVDNGPTNATDPTGLELKPPCGFPGPGEPPWKVEPLPGWPDHGPEYPHSPSWKPTVDLRGTNKQAQEEAEWYRDNMRKFTAWYRAHQKYHALEDAHMWEEIEESAREFQAEVEEEARRQAEEYAEMYKTLIETELHMLEEAMQRLREAMYHRDHTPYIPPPGQGGMPVLGPGAVGLPGGTGASGGATGETSRER